MCTKIKIKNSIIQDSEFTGFFSFWIGRAKEGGFVRKVESKYVPDGRQKNSNNNNNNGEEDEDESNAVGFGSTVLPVAALAAGAAAAMVLAAGERIMPSQQSQKTVFSFNKKR